MREIFDLYDNDHSGTLTVKELTEALETGGMTKDEIVEIFKSGDTNGDNLISFDEFTQLMGDSDLFG